MMIFLKLLVILNLSLKNVLSWLVNGLLLEMVIKVFLLILINPKKLNFVKMKKFNKIIVDKLKKLKYVFGMDEKINKFDESKFDSLFSNVSDDLDAVESNINSIRLLIDDIKNKRFSSASTMDSYSEFLVYSKNSQNRVLNKNLRNLIDYCNNLENKK